MLFDICLYFRFLCCRDRNTESKMAAKIVADSIIDSIIGLMFESEVISRSLLDEVIEECFEVKEEVDETIESESLYSYPEEEEQEDLPMPGSSSPKMGPLGDHRVPNNSEILLDAMDDELVNFHEDYVKENLVSCDSPHDLENSFDIKTEEDEVVPTYHDVNRVPDFDVVQCLETQFKRRKIEDKTEETVYHSLCGVSMPKLLNKAPRLGLSRTGGGRLKPLHTKWTNPN